MTVFAFCWSARSLDAQHWKAAEVPEETRVIVSDLTPVAGERLQQKGVVVLGVGWIGPETPVSTGVVGAELVERLERYSRHSVNLTRGLEVCRLCEPNRVVVYEAGSERLLLGSGELWFLGSGTLAFAAPNMLLHYVVFHGYAPPPLFLRFVASAFLPDSLEYAEQAKFLGLVVGTTPRSPAGDGTFRMGPEGRFVPDTVFVSDQELRPELRRSP